MAQREELRPASLVRVGRPPASMSSIRYGIRAPIIPGLGRGAGHIALDLLEHITSPARAELVVVGRVEILLVRGIVITVERYPLSGADQVDVALDTFEVEARRHLVRVLGVEVGTRRRVVVAVERIEVGAAGARDLALHPFVGVAQAAASELVEIRRVEVIAVAWVIVAIQFLPGDLRE